MVLFAGSGSYEEAMNMQTKIPTAPASGADVLAVLDRRIRELVARRAVITEQIIALKKTVSARNDEINADLVQAEALLDGAKFVASREKPLSELAALHAERRLIDRALQIGRSRRHRIAAERAGDIWASYFGKIAQVEKRRVMQALQLQRTNREREKLRDEITAAGGAGFLCTDGADLLGLGDREDETRWAVKRVVDDGIATHREIEKLSHG